MKVVALFFAVGIAMHLHGASLNAQEDSESDRIKALIAELTQKAQESKLQLKELYSRYGEQHPRVRQFESQLKDIANAKNELASKLAMIQISDVHKELKNHANILSKHISAIKEMMEAKVDDEFKKEYGKIHEHAHKVIQMIQEQINEKHKDVAQELKNIFSDSNIDPEKVAKSYDRAMFDSLSNAIAKKRYQALAELEAAKAAQEKSTSINKDLERRIHQLEARLAQEKAVSDEKIQLIELEKRKAAETQSALEDALRIADLKFKKYAMEKQKMDLAIDQAKTLRSSAKDKEMNQLKELYSQLTKAKSETDKATQSVDSRLKKVEKDVSQIKSLLEELVKKIK